MTRRPRGFALWRIARGRPRLFLCGALGVVVALATALTPWRGVTRLLLAWDLALVVYLILVGEVMARADPHMIRRRAAVEDEGALALLVLTVAAGLSSVAAIFAELGGAHDTARSPLSLALAASTVILSWTFIHTMFALHYAHEFYGEDAVEGGGLAFPGGLREPDYWDFVYFSFVIGMTSQVSDVAVTGRSIRRTVTVHGVIAFVFNVAFLALTVSMAGSLIQGG